MYFCYVFATLVVLPLSQAGKQSDPIENSYHNEQLSLLLVRDNTGHSPGDVLETVRRRTAERYRQSGVRVQEIEMAHIDSWIKRDACDLADAMTSFKMLHYATDKSVDAIGGLYQCEPYVKDHKTQERGLCAWLLNLRRCTSSRVRRSDLAELKARGFELRDEIDMLLDIRRRKKHRRPYTLDSQIPKILLYNQLQPLHGFGATFLGVWFSQETIEAETPIVGRIATDSPAARTGLRVGDIILELDGVSIVSTSSFMESIRSRPVGSTVNIRVKRESLDTVYPVELISGQEYFRLRSKSFLQTMRLVGKVQSISGDPVVISDHAGKVVVLFFWATWCGPCKPHLPILHLLSEKYGPNRLTWIGVSVDQDDRRWRKFVANNRMGGIQVRSPDWADAFGVTSYPTTVFIGVDGTILGTCSPERISLEVHRLLAP